MRFAPRFAAAAIFAVLSTAVVSAQTNATPSPAPSSAPAAAPTATPAPLFTWGGALSGASYSSNPANATGALDTATGADQTTRTDLTNALVDATVNLGRLSAGATAGYYSFPIVGAAINPIDQAGANTTLYSALPLYDVSYAVNSHLSFQAGKLVTLLGQESPFTYQNFNVQRGFGWAIEPLISRGIRGVYANGPWTLSLEENDGYYGGTSRAFEGALAYAASATQTISFAAIVPQTDAPPNPTAAIANKREYDLMYAGTFGKVVLTPYLLWVSSPAVPGFKYGTESAFLVSLLGTYNFTPQYSLGFRFETIGNGSAASDQSANADLIGYGPGSSARSITLTPTYKSGPYFARFEWSHVSVGTLTPGLGFGTAGDGASQNRYVLELGVTH